MEPLVPERVKVFMQSSILSGTAEAIYEEDMDGETMNMIRLVLKRQ